MIASRPARTSREESKMKPYARTFPDKAGPCYTFSSQQTSFRLVEGRKLVAAETTPISAGLLYLWRVNTRLAPSESCVYGRPHSEVAHARH
jgi:hypothetical protein